MWVCDSETTKSIRCSFLQFVRPGFVHLHSYLSILLVIIYSCLKAKKKKKAVADVGRIVPAWERT